MHNALKSKYYFCNSFGKTYIDLDSFPGRLDLSDVRLFTLCPYLCWCKYVFICFAAEISVCLIPGCCCGFHYTV